MTKKIDIAIVGATGAVGEMFVEILQQRQFPVRKLYPLASERSEGEVIQFDGRSHRVKNLENFDFSQVQMAFFSAGSTVSAKYVPIAAEAGCIVIDNSSSFVTTRTCRWSFRKLIRMPWCITVTVISSLTRIVRPFKWWWL